MAGSIDRFGSVDPSDGGGTPRTSLSADWSIRRANSATQLSA
jgi:hypothetical protein